MELTRQKKESVTYYFQYRPTDISFILAETGYARICMPAGLLLFIGHVCEPSANTSTEHLVLFVPVTIPIIFHMKRKHVLFPFSHEKTFWHLSALPGYGIFDFCRQIAQNDFFLYFYASFSLLIITKKPFLKTGYICKKLWDSFDDWLWDCR